jgi:uncharacterized protein (DUF111 family)
MSTAVWRILKGLSRRAGLPDAAKEKSIEIFTRLAQAEAKVHRSRVEEIHFHEVGALDAIVDIVGAVSGLRRLGIEEVYSSPLHIGTGFVHCAHGTIPVPAPATVELLKGVPVYSQGIDSELVTPTGAAILTSYCRHYGPMPPMRLLSCGYGAGDKGSEYSQSAPTTAGRENKRGALRRQSAPGRPWGNRTGRGASFGSQY